MNKKKNGEFNEKTINYEFERGGTNGTVSEERKTNYVRNASLLSNYNNSNKVINESGGINDKQAPDVYSFLNDDNGEYEWYRRQSNECYGQANAVNKGMCGGFKENGLNSHRNSWEVPLQREVDRNAYVEKTINSFNIMKSQAKRRMEGTDLYEGRVMVQDRQGCDVDGLNYFRENYFDTKYGYGGYEGDTDFKAQGIGSNLRYKPSSDDYASVGGNKRIDCDFGGHKIVLDAIIRIQSVFEDVYTHLHNILLNLSNNGGFGPFTDMLISHLEAFRVTASKAVYPSEDRLYYKDVELEYRRGFDGRKQLSFYKNKYQMLYEENKNAEAVKHLAKIDGSRKERKDW